jgi:serralysin
MRKMRTHLSKVTTLGVAAVAGTGIALWPASPASSVSLASAALAQEGATAFINPSGGSQLYAFINYNAGDGEANDVTITQGAGPRDFVIDDVVPIQAGEGCAHPDEGDLTRVVCTVAPVDEGHAYFYIDLGDMNDTLEASSSESGEVSGGPGDDTIAPAWPGNFGGLYGDEGDDTLSGATEMNGGDGNDTITGPKNTDTNVYGDAGRDTITTFGGDDTIYGDEGLEDWPGYDDEIRAGGGNDRMWGEDGDDALYGEAGDDTISGGAGEDIIDGGPGNDEETQD